MTDVALPTLALDETEVEVQIFPPLAHVTTVRRFVNSSDHAIEAVLTLPPLDRSETIHRLVVRINGLDHETASQPAGSARRVHYEASADARCAILGEMLDQDIPRVSIAWIAAGARVEILIWSIRPLARPDQNRATLVLSLDSACHPVGPGLSCARVAITARDHGVASLRISVGDFRVTIAGQPYPDRDLTPNEAIGVDSAAPIRLDITPLNGSSLDHSEWQVGMPGGWEVTSAGGVETFRHARNPGGQIVSDRDDWIFGIVPTNSGVIRVTAPLPTMGNAPNAGGLFEIAPNARGLRAFAAAGLVEAATPRDTADVRRTANILSGTTSLAFVSALPMDERSGMAAMATRSTNHVHGRHLNKRRIPGSTADRANDLDWAHCCRSAE